MPLVRPVTVKRLAPVTSMPAPRGSIYWPEEVPTYTRYPMTSGSGLASQVTVAVPGPFPREDADPAPVVEPPDTPPPPQAMSCRINATAPMRWRIEERSNPLRMRFLIIVPYRGSVPTRTTLFFVTEP